MPKSLRPENVPAPTGFKILIKLKDPPNKIGSIHIPDAVKDVQRHMAFVCQVMELGPAAYSDPEKTPGKPWCQPGDWVLTSYYAGTRFMVDDHEYRILNDDEVQGVTAEAFVKDIKRAG